MKNADLIEDFEKLVEELMKEEPNENEVKHLMERLDIEYHTDSVRRIADVLEKMNNVVFESKKKKGNYDLQ